MCEGTCCPCCSGKAKCLTHENGGHESQCLACGWWERVPGSDAISAAITLHGSQATQSPPRLPQYVTVCANCSRTFTEEEDLAEISDLWGRVLPGDTMPSGECRQCGALCYPADAEQENVGERQPQTVGNVDRELLERQAAILGRIVDGDHPTEEERSCLEGVWEFLHRILDSPCPAVPPTVVMYIDGGVLMAAESNIPVRTILCDYDLKDGDTVVGGQRCHVDVRGVASTPSEEFNEILEIVAREEHVEEHNAERP